MYWSNNNSQTTAIFTWTDGPWTDARSGVEVRIDEITDLQTPYPDPTRADFTVVLVEVDARTT
jgi:hypothetical protein